MAKNDIQLSCTGLGEPEFMIGEVYGLRHWRVDDMFVEPASMKTMCEPVVLELVGHYGHYWSLDTENVATCSISHNSKKVLAKQVSLTEESMMEAVSAIADNLDRQLSRESQPIDSAVLSGYFSDSPYSVSHTLDIRAYSLAGMPDVFIYHALNKMLSSLPEARPAHSYMYPSVGFVTLTLQERAKPHTVAHPDCVCGFYAYTDTKSLYDNSPSWSTGVYGLVKASGHMTVGTKGFRAEKAKIVALTSVYDEDDDRIIAPSYMSTQIHILPSQMRQRPPRQSLLGKIDPLLLPSGIETFHTVDDLLADLKTKGITLGL